VICWLPSLEGEFVPLLSAPVVICKTVVVFAEDGPQKGCVSSHLPFLQIKTVSAFQCLQGGRQQNERIYQSS